MMYTPEGTTSYIIYMLIPDTHTAIMSIHMLAFLRTIHEEKTSEEWCFTHIKLIIYWINV